MSSDKYDGPSYLSELKLVQPHRATLFLFMVLMKQGVQKPFSIVNHNVEFAELEAVNENKLFIWFQIRNMRISVCLQGRE